MSTLFACFGIKQRRDSTAVSETSDFSANGFKNGGDSSSQQEVVYVELLRRMNQPLGLVLKGGTDKGFPLQVAELHSGGVAEQSGALQIDDRIRSINGTVTDYLTNDEASNLLESAKTVVNLEIAFDALPDWPQKIDDGMELKTAFVALLYEDTLGPGFVISGGRLDNRPITVSHVKPGSYPYKKGVLRVGDRILQVNGRDMRNASQTDFSDTLKGCGTSFTLQIEYDVTTHEGLEETAGPLMVELQKPHGASLGISLSGNQLAGEPIYISKVRDAGIADRSGALHVGDQLLSINGQQLEGRTLLEARHMMAHSDINVILEVIPSHNLTSERLGSVSRGEDRISDSVSRASHSIEACDYMRKPSRLSLASSYLSSTQIKTHPETTTIKLRADSVGFGMGLEGGTTEFGMYPITISSIEPNGPAERLGQLLVGDRVIAINGQKLLDETLQQAYKLIQEGDDEVELEVEYDVQDFVSCSSTNEFTLQQMGNLQWGITLRGNKDRLWIASVLKGGVASRMGCVNPGDILIAINGQEVQSMAPKDVLELINTSGDTVSITTRRETINNFATSRRSSHQGKSDDVIYSVELERGNQSLGISLQGSERKGQPIIISHIKEGGVAHRTRAIRAGDRVLAINGESLFSKSLDDAVRILQSAGSRVTIKISKGVVSRRRTKNRPGSGRNYRNPKYRFNRSALYPSRASHTSDSELSTYGCISETNLERPPSNMTRHSPRGAEPGRKFSRYNDPGLVGGAGLPGRHSPSRFRYSPPGRGRNSPPKDPTWGDKMGSNKNGIPSGLPSSELSGLRIKKRDSFNETTDDETTYEGDVVIPTKYNYQSPSYYSNLDASSVENGIGDWSPGHSGARLPKIAGSLSRKKSGDRLSPVGKGSYPDPMLGRRNLHLDHKMEEAILKQLEDALLKSKEFVDKLTELANQSGSSDPDSDSEPLKERLRPHIKQQLLKHVREIMVPQRMELVDLRLVRSSRSAGFGLSLSDGLLESGVFVNQIQPGGAACIAGLCRYDKIIKFNDEIVQDADCCKVKPMFSLAGEEVLLTVARNPLASNNGAAAHSTSSPVLLERDEYEESEIN